MNFFKDSHKFKHQYCVLKITMARHSNINRYGSIPKTHLRAVAWGKNIFKLFKSLSFIFLLNFLMMMVTGCQKNRSDYSETIPPVRVTTLKDTLIHFPIHFSGKLEADNQAALSFSTGGTVKSILVKEGEKVSKGTKLAQLDLTEIKAEYEKAKRAYEEASWNFTRIQKLVKENVLSQAEFEKARTVLQMARSAYQRAEYNLKNSVISAYTDGIILKILVNENERIAPGMPVIIFGPSNNKWIIKTSVPSRWMARIHYGNPFTAHLIDFPEVKLKGILESISGMTNPVTGTLDITLRIDSINQSLNFRSGLPAKGTIFSDQMVRGLLIPYSAILESEEERIKFFIIRPDSTIVSTYGRPLLFLDEYAIIENPSIIGEKIIADGGGWLYEGQKVDPK